MEQHQQDQFKVQQDERFKEGDEEKSDNDIFFKIFAPKQKTAEEKIKGDVELLGSVTTVNCPGVRTSARVIQKMKQDLKQDSTLPSQTQSVEKKDVQREEKVSQKAPLPVRPKVVWSNTEKSLFFDALNEFGRDFESIANFINSKLKRKSPNDVGYKSKENVRQTFFQTFHKISKYIKFSDEVKRPAQEVYALINYGEMRKRLTFVSEKNCMKIKDLVYKGYANVRSKGKNVRIKTPSCKALRKLNQLEDWLEDIKLPNKVEICLRPATMESWGRVQSLGQNPAVRTVVPLQKKLVNVIKTFQVKWRSHELKMQEEALKLIGSGHKDPLRFENKSFLEERAGFLHEPLLHFKPSRDTIIHRPLVSITEYLSSFNICLNSYEERLGVQIRGETLCHDKMPSKRQRTDSGCEKKSPEHKKIKCEQEIRQVNCDFVSEKPEKEEKETKVDLNEITSDDPVIESITETNYCKLERQDSNEIENIPDTGDNGKNPVSPTKEQCPTENNVGKQAIEVRQRRKDIKCLNKKKDIKKELSNLKPLLNDNVIKQIRKGWTVLNCGDITVGDLYVAIGHDSKIMFEYDWLNAENSQENGSNGVPYNANNNEGEHIKKIRQSSLGNRLKQLLLIANLTESARRKPCYCGHICDSNYRYKHFEAGISPRSFVSSKVYEPTGKDNVIFRQPQTPSHKSAVYMEQNRRVASDVRTKPIRFLKSGTFGSKQIVIKRLLPVQNGGTPQIEVKTLEKHFQMEANMKSLNSAPSISNKMPQESFAERTDTLSTSSSENSIQSDKNSLEFVSTSKENIHKQIIEHEQDNFLLTTNQQTQQKDNTTEINDLVIVSNNNARKEESNESEFLQKKEIGKSHMDMKNQLKAVVPHLEDEIKDKIIQDLINTSVKATDQSTECKNELIFNEKQQTSLDDVSDLSQLMDLSLPSPLPITSLDESTNDTFSGIPPLSPMQIIREGPSDPKWLEANINDFSLSSFLGHLEDMNSRDETDNTNMSEINDSGVDYVSTFAEITASIQSDHKDL